MVDFYFIDTNLIMGYVNFHDEQNLISKIVLERLEDRYTILLQSIEEEFIRKIQDIMADFARQIINLIDSGETKLDQIKQSWNYNNRSFDEFIFGIIKANGNKDITIPEIFSIQLDYEQKIQENFNHLTEHWIKYPKQTEKEEIKNSTIYKKTISRLESFSQLHQPDIEHLAVAFYRANKRRQRDHNHAFYTADRVWKIVNNILNNNFQIKITKEERVYVGRKKKNIYVQDIYNKLSTSCFCIIEALGHSISSAVDSVLLLKNTLINNLEILDINLGTKTVKDSKKISFIRIKVFFTN